jgi:hypothetical protein
VSSCQVTRPISCAKQVWSAGCEIDERFTFTSLIVTTPSFTFVLKSYTTFSLRWTFFAIPS